MKVELAKEAYSGLALQKAAYQVAADFRVSISDCGPNFMVEIESLQDDQSEFDINPFLLVASDYSLRERLSEQTEPLRNLILAHAYSKTSFIKE